MPILRAIGVTGDGSNHKYLETVKETITTETRLPVEMDEQIFTNENA